MSINYVRTAYGVPAKVGGRVTYRNASGTKVREGVITGASHYIHVRFDNAMASVPIHPKDERLTYL